MDIITMETAHFIGPGAVDDQLIDDQQGAMNAIISVLGCAAVLYPCDGFPVRTLQQRHTPVISWAPMTYCCILQ